MAKKRGSEGSKIGVGIILGYKYLNGYAEGYAETAVKIIQFKQILQKQGYE